MLRLRGPLYDVQQVATAFSLRLYRLGFDPAQAPFDQFSIANHTDMMLTNQVGLEGGDPLARQRYWALCGLNWRRDLLAVELRHLAGDCRSSVRGPCSEVSVCLEECDRPLTARDALHCRDLRHAPIQGDLVDTLH